MSLGQQLAPHLPFLRRYGVNLAIYPAKGYSVSIPIEGHNGAPQVSLTDDEASGYTVRDDDDDDPELVLLPSGEVVDTWRENYPYDERMKRSEYEEQKRLLQIELL